MDVGVYFAFYRRSLNGVENFKYPFGKRLEMKSCVKSGFILDQVFGVIDGLELFSVRTKECFLLSGALHLV